MRRRDTGKIAKTRGGEAQHFLAAVVGQVVGGAADGEGAAITLCGCDK
jgi:hypothetical protein